MARVKRGNKRLLKRKKILDRASGFYGTKSKAHRVAKLAVDKALGYAYRDRRQKKRHMRSLWIVRINAAARLSGLPPPPPPPPERPLLQPPHRRPQGRRLRAGPQGAGRDGRRRSGRFRGHRRA